MYLRNENSKSEIPRVGRSGLAGFGIVLEQYIVGLSPKSANGYDADDRADLSPISCHSKQCT